MARPRDEGATLMMIRRAREWVLLACTAAFAQPAPPVAKADAGPHYDVLISGGAGYDGSGGAPLLGGVGITGDRPPFVRPPPQDPARGSTPAHGEAGGARAV